jgi:nicotinamidase/pyrazinamidase
LHELGIERLFVTGLATDYCVRQTVLDARRLGFQVVLLQDGIKGIDASPGDSSRAVADMQGAGAFIAQSSTIGM